MHAGGPLVRRRSVTLEEVAIAAEVSRPTASVILNGAKSGTRVSKATRQRVVEVAASMGYRPNVLAQNLATGRANRIGFYSGRAKLDCTNPYFSEVLGGIFSGAEELGLDTIVHTSGVSEARILDLVRGHTLDGLIVHAMPGDPILALLAELHVPAVAVADEIPGISSVTADDRTGGALLAEHLLELGHRHVLVKQALLPPPSALARVAAFSKTFVSYSGRISLGWENWSGEPVARDELSLLSGGPGRATAIMAWSDAVAEAICESLLGAGFAIPDDVSIVGFDGFRHRHAPRYRLTTIQAPWAAVGREAVHLVYSQLASTEIPEIKVLPVVFQRGDTTGPPP